MGAPPKYTTSSTTSAAAARKLKREDCRRTKHDSAFSKWKILIGPSDWENHKMGKEGAERYRTQNLPNDVSRPGLYELAVVPIECLEQCREARKLDSESVIPVYVGQAENVRTRLQQYGRDGAHVENAGSNDEYTNYGSVSSNKGPRLFSETFARGYAIAYRYAPMKSKKDAEIAEKELLDTFDYAWNKERNGARRKDDIFRKLENYAKASLFSRLAKKILFRHGKQEGIRIRNLDLVKNGSNGQKAKKHFIFSTFRIRRLQPAPFPHSHSRDCTDICGVSIGHGSICTTPPAKGRKRCAEHKGMRVNGHISKLNTKGYVPSNPVSIDYGVVAGRYTAAIQIEGLKDFTVTNQPCEDEQCGNKNFAPICGVILENGSPCKQKPSRRNKRCLQHKGRRIH